MLNSEKSQYESLLDEESFKKYQQSLKLIESEYEERISKIDHIGKDRKNSVEKLAYIGNKYLNITAMLHSLLKHIPISYAAIDLNGNIIISSDDTCTNKKSYSQYNVYSWDRIWDFYDEEDKLLAIDEHPAIKALNGTSVGPKVFKLVSLDTNADCYCEMWSEPVFIGPELVGASLFFSLVKGFNK